MFGLGALISVSVIIAFYLGLKQSPAVASTMAFATLTLARLFHGFNCRSDSSIFKIGFTSNLASIGAFVLGVLLLSLVIFVPGLHSLFSVADIAASQAGIVLALAAAPTILIQIIKVIVEKIKK